MALQIRHPKDFYAGVIFIVVGVAALLIGRDYSLGTTTRMGPGYFPALLGALLTLLGLIISLRSLIFDGPAVGQIGFRPLVLILASMLAFAGLLEPAGLVIATAALIAIGCLGSVESRARCDHSQHRFNRSRPRFIRLRPRPADENLAWILTWICSLISVSVSPLH